MTPCPTCGVILSVGVWPFCPHGAVNMGIVDDTVTGGPRYFHNLGDEPIWIETRSELKKIMDARGLVHRESDRYNRDDKSPWATRTRLRAGMRDPFLERR